MGGSTIQLQVRKLPSDTTAQRQSFGFGILDGGDASMNVNTLTGGAYGNIKPLTGDLQYSLEAVNPSGSVLISRDINYFSTRSLRNVPFPGQKTLRCQAGWLWWPDQAYLQK